jgi:hypothetical protein
MTYCYSFRNKLEGKCYDATNYWGHDSTNFDSTKPSNFVSPNEYQERLFPTVYSSSDSESSQSRVPTYNSMVIGHSTRSLIQHVSVKYLWYYL